MYAKRLLCRFPSTQLSFHSTTRIVRRAVASSFPRPNFQSTGFEVIDPSQKVEEERLPFYNRNDYYPMRIGEVLKYRYQVVVKLGYGASSTVWLCRDLGYSDSLSCFDCPIANYDLLLSRDRSYQVLKAHVNTLEHNQELEVFKHLSSITVEHSGRQHVRQLDDTFKIKSRNGEHEFFGMKPLGMSMRTLQELQKSGVFAQNVVKGALD